MINYAYAHNNHAKLSQGFWAYVLLTTIYVINLSPNVASKGQELCTSKAPQYDHLRVFGCKSYAHVPKQLRQKFDYK